MSRIKLILVFLLGASTVHAMPIDELIRLYYSGTGVAVEIVYDLLYDSTHEQLFDSTHEVLRARE